MNGIENKVQRNIRKAKVQQVILATIQTGGLIALSMLGPNVLKIIGPDLKNYALRKKSQSIINARRTLLKNGLIKVVNGHYKITNDGVSALNYCLINRDTKKPKRWDGKWRTLIFDIPEKKRYIRDKVRNTLEHLGFKRLQDSVWIYPYPCEEVIALMKVDFKVGKDLLYMVVDHIENDKWLIEDFGLED